MFSNLKVSRAAHSHRFGLAQEFLLQMCQIPSSFCLRGEDGVEHLVRGISTCLAFGGIIPVYGCVLQYYGLSGILVHLLYGKPDVPEKTIVP